MPRVRLRLPPALRPDAAPFWRSPSSTTILRYSGLLRSAVYSAAMKRIVLIVFFIAAALFFAYRFVLSDRRQIQGHFNELAEDITSLAELQPLDRIALVKKHSKRLAERVSVHLTSGSEQKKFTFTRADFDRKAVAAQQAIGKLEVKLEEFSFEVQEDSATAHFQVYLLGSLNGMEGEFYDHWSVIVGLIRREGEWLLQDIKGENLRPDPQMP